MVSEVGKHERARVHRPRVSTWGSELDRALLQAIAERITVRQDFSVCAIEVLRSDRMLEFVAIANSPAGSERLLGQASPLTVMEQIRSGGTEIGAWVFVDSTQLDQETQDVLQSHGHRPDLEPIDAPGAWLADDMLFRPLLGADGDLRGLLYLDEPRSGLRPTEADVAELEDKMHVAMESVVAVIERESFGEQIRMVQAARAAIQSVRGQLSEDELIELVAAELPGALRADSVSITPRGQGDPAWDEVSPLLGEALKRVWRRRGELILEPGRAWGDDEVARHAEDFRELLDLSDIASLVIVPIGIGDEFLGSLGLARRTGAVRWADSEIRGAHAVAGDIAGVLADARSLEREVRLNAELRHLDDYRRAMIHNIAHELRNPVGVLRGNIEMVDTDKMPAAARGALEAMERAAQRIETMTANLVTLSKVTDTTRPLEADPVDLSTLMYDVVQYLEVLATHAGVELVVDIEDGLVVDGDEDELHTVAANVVGNAIKYSDVGGRVWVSLTRCHQECEGALFRCVDEGIGIAEADQSRVFDPFFRSADTSARARPGTGLGLAIVKEVVERHRGRIGVASVPGQGSTFDVCLPAFDSAPEEESLAEESLGEGEQ